MPRMTDERRGAMLLAARREVVAARGDDGGVGHLLLLRYLSLGLGEAADPEATMGDMMIAVAKHAHGKGVEPERVLQSLAMPGRPVDDGSVLGGAAAVFDAMRTTCGLSGMDFDDMLGRVTAHLDVEMPRPGM